MKEYLIEDKLLLDGVESVLYYRKKGTSVFREIHFSDPETLLNQISTLGKIIFSSFPHKKEGYVVAKNNNCYCLYRFIKDNKVKYFHDPCSHEIKDVSNLGINAVCIIPGKSGEETYVLNKFVPGFPRYSVQSSPHAVDK